MPCESLCMRYPEELLTRSGAAVKASMMNFLDGTRGQDPTPLYVPVLKDGEDVPYRLARYIETWVAELVGKNNVRKWLIDFIARIREEGQDDNPQAQISHHLEVPEQRSMRLQSLIREQVLHMYWTLGISFVTSITPFSSSPRHTDLVRGYLASVVDGRLLPTLWLNSGGFRDVMYLKDKPTYEPDTRTEMERRFPQLFRESLRKKGWEKLSFPDNDDAA